MKIKIPRGKEFDIKHIVSDYNGTIALDGKLVEGVAELINELSKDIKFHVITADSFGSVEKELYGINCEVFKIGPGNQDKAKAEYVKKLGSDNVVALGNGKNDFLMLEEAVLGIGILYHEGICTETLLASKIVCSNPIDALQNFKNPKRLIATLRRE
ncbi:MAG: hypothetical protein WBG30_06370 [Psychrilyobacter sp.]|uniref:HAD family hydrolase n=1 Tax=Psychrilyobacter sp. TaxID=2586924 RepID=UPI003C77650C